MDANGRRVVALRGEDDLLHCPLCSYAVPPLKAKNMNRHTCTTNEPTGSTADPDTGAVSSDRPRITQISPPRFPNVLASVYTANLLRDKHLDKFSLAIDTKHRVLICQLHQVVINGNIQSVENHLKHHSHPMSGFQQSTPSISSVLNGWGIPTETPQRPVRAVVPVSGIEPPRDGYQCLECPYAVIAYETARKHADSSGHHKMNFGRVQRVQNIYWKILPKEDWEIHSVDLATKDLALINAITNSLMNPRVAENETDNVCVCQSTLFRPLLNPTSLGMYHSSSRIRASATHIKTATWALWSSSSLFRPKTLCQKPLKTSRYVSASKR